MLLVSLLLILILALLILEIWMLGSSRDRIANRIHINGTRGKSTVTEYIAAALLEPGSQTWAKITGVVPTLFVDGKRSTIRRAGGARVQEQFRMIRKAGASGCKNLVLECMSIDPALQQLESKFFKPHIYVITNIRDDHRETMGRSATQQVKAICDAIPKDCKLVTSEDVHLEEILTAASGKNTEVIVADSAEAPGWSLPEGVFLSNLAMALKVSQLCGVDKELAFQRIAAHIDSEGSRLTTLDRERDLLLLNGFDVNEPASADEFLEKWRSETGWDRPLIAVFNSRSDRPLRTGQFATWLAGIRGITSVLVSGDHRKRARLALRKAGMKPERIVEVRSRELRHIRKHILNLAEERSLVLTIGNIAGDGFKIMEELS